MGKRELWYFSCSCLWFQSAELSWARTGEEYDAKATGNRVLYCPWDSSGSNHEQKKKKRKLLFKTDHSVVWPVTTHTRLTDPEDSRRPNKVTLAKMAAKIMMSFLLPPFGYKTHHHGCDLNESTDRKRSPWLVLASPQSQFQWFQQFSLARCQTLKKLHRKQRLHNLQAPPFDISLDQPWERHAGKQKQAAYLVEKTAEKRRRHTQGDINTHVEH